MTTPEFDPNRSGSRGPAIVTLLILAVIVLAVMGLVLSSVAGR